MTLVRPTARRPLADTQAVERLVLVSAGPNRELVLVPRRRRDAALARLGHRRLDDRLAAGELPETSRLLATRAAQLVRTRSRRRLARRWDELAIQIRLNPARTTVTIDVADDLQHVARALRADHLILAEGAAIAATMLGSARGAVSRFTSGGDDIAAAIARAAITAMGHHQLPCAAC